MRAGVEAISVQQWADQVGSERVSDWVEVTQTMIDRFAEATGDHLGRAARTAQVDGEVNLFDPTAKTDATVKFRNVEMVNLTPYTATFAGRRIASGKLALDLAYQIEHGKLLGDNRIVMDELTLGEKVESADAPDLPDQEFR